jgi:hypothetical protein
MTDTIEKTNRRNPSGVKNFADQYRTFGGRHYICLDCGLSDETLAENLTRLRDADISARKVGDAIYVRHDQAAAAGALFHR